MSSADINAKLENMRDVFISDVFNNEIKNVPSVKFGTVHRMDHIQYCIGVNKSGQDNDIADEIVIDASITSDRFNVASALLTGLITAYAREKDIKITSRASSTHLASNKKEYDDYCGSYHNKKFKALADRFGLVVKESKLKYGWIPIDVSENIKALVKQKRWNFPTQREKYVYGEDPSTSNMSSRRKCICPNCKKISFYETKQQNLYCAECMEKIARKEFGSKWDNFLQNYEASFKIQRATVLTE